MNRIIHISSIFNCSSWILLMLVTMTGAQFETRCYCNDASCVRTSYMCKSTTGTCFSKVTLDVAANVRRGYHGCVELLPEADRSACAVGDSISRSRGDAGRMPALLVCCREDMCNYMGEPGDEFDLPVRNSRINNTEGLNGLDLLSPGTGSDGPGHHLSFDKTFVQQSSSNQQTPLADPSSSSQRDVWFRAAVISVPVVGALILVLLVIVAVRLLRGDRRHRQRHCVSLIGEQQQSTCQTKSPAPAAAIPARPYPAYNDFFGPKTGRGGGGLPPADKGSTAVDMSFCCHGNAQTCSCSGQNRCLLNYNSEKLFPFGHVTHVRSTCCSVKTTKTGDGLSAGLIGSILNRSEPVGPIWTGSKSVGTNWNSLPRSGPQTEIV